MIRPEIFYTYMQYPVPEPIDFFVPEQKTITTNTASRKYTNPHTHRLITKVNKYNRLYKNIPFVKAIYLCDGISFNASKETSDIDLFFVVEDGCIRRARFASVCLFWILWIKRSLHNKAWKFDLIFYVTQSHSNLKHIRLSPEDPYIYHWLSHLIPIYNEDQKHSIYRQNSRLYETFPNLPKDKHIIDLWIPITHGDTIYKKMGQYILWSKVRERIIGTIRSYIIKRKAHKRKDRIEDLIITTNMLKFHKDRRLEIAKAIHDK